MKKLLLIISLFSVSYANAKNQGELMLLRKQIIDLSHTVSPTSPTWKNTAAFTSSLSLDYDECIGFTEFRVQQICFKIGVGTHIDAPAHCIREGRTIDQLSLKELIAPCFVIDATADASSTSLATLELVQAFERKYRISFTGAIVLFNTSWSKLWNKPGLYRNDLNFPAISGEAAQYLIDQGALAIGIDTLSPDRPSEKFSVHEIVLGADKYIIENIANLDQLPPTGATLMVMPLPFTGITEAPVRILAILP